MNIHKNARLTPHGRAELARRVVECGHSIAEVSAAFHVCSKTARKWVERFRRNHSATRCCRVERPPHRLLFTANNGRFVPGGVAQAKILFSRTTSGAGCRPRNTLALKWASLALKWSSPALKLTKMQITITATFIKSKC
jgi:hypothetical protein